MLETLKWPMTHMFYNSNWIVRHHGVTPTLNCLFSDVDHAHRLLVNLKHRLLILLLKEKTTCIGPNVKHLLYHKQTKLSYGTFVFNVP